MPTKVKEGQTPKKPVKPAEHPTYAEMIKVAITSLKERNGSSRQAIVKYIAANYKVGDGSATHVKMALKRGVAKGWLSQPKGVGASGSFKLAKKATEVKKKPAAKKPAAKKPAAKKATAAKKPATVKQAKKPAAKKPAAKKQTAKKATTAKSPKKPAAKKATKPAQKKPAAKKPATKKPAAKKPAAKKPAAKKQTAKKAA